MIWLFLVPYLILSTIIACLLTFLVSGLSRWLSFKEALQPFVLIFFGWPLLVLGFFYLWFIEAIRKKPEDNS